VLDGLATLAETLHASAPVLWIHDDDPVTSQALLEAVRERQRIGLDEPPVTVRAVAPAYLSGESSAIKQALAGGPVLPGFQRAGGSASVAGPVVVHNVETLAQLSRLPNRRGPAAPTDQAVVETSAVRLLTILTPQDRRVIGVPVDARLDEAVLLATGTRVPPAATVLLGGFGGLWARWSDVAGSAVDESVLRANGYTLGPGIVAPLWEPSCGVAVTAAITDYLVAASAGQCGPCLFGLRALADSLERLRTGRVRRGELRRLHDDLTAVAGRGACHHPDGAVRLVSSALEVFADDVAAHVHGAPCPASHLPIPVPGTRVAGA
jgi:NADH:ubiquinone oxidoreductase subunit F (NADH-binding)